MQQPGSSFQLTTQRLEAFSDGVFAIAITLLVLEIRVPRAAEADGPFTLSAELLKLWPSYFGYIFSFVMIGIYWANHHYLFTLYKRSDHVFALLNIFFLMCISFLPFPTAVLAEYIVDPAHQQDAIVLYTTGLFLPALAWLLMWLYASRNRRLLDPRLDQQFVVYLTRQFVLSNILYFSAIVLALWNGIAGLALCLGLTALYAFPPKPPVYRSADHAGSDAPQRAPA